MYILAKSKWIFTGQQKANLQHLLAKLLSLPQNTRTLNLFKKKNTQNRLFFQQPLSSRPLNWFSCNFIYKNSSKADMDMEHFSLKS